jgi:hypothetical protein
MIHTDPPVLFYTQVFASYERLSGHALRTGGDGCPFREGLAPAVTVLDFTYTLGVVFYNRDDQCGH